VPSSQALALLTEEDIGPVGPLISVWGFDPTEAVDTTFTSSDKTIVRPRFLSAEDFVLPAGAIKHPRVLMPLPGAMPAKNDERFVAVSVVSFPVTFADGSRDGYADLDLTPIKDAPNPVIRLGVVRMQLNARLDSVMTPRQFRKASARPRGISPRIEETKMSDQTKDCEECFGTGNEARMRAVQPGRNILFQPCPECGGTGKVKSPPSE